MQWWLWVVVVAAVIAAAIVFNRLRVRRGWLRFW